MNWIRTSGTSIFLAFVLSFALWAYVSFTSNPERSTSFDSMGVHVQNRPEGLIIVDQDGLPRPDQTMLSQVNITVRTDQETLSKLSQKYLNAFVDLSGLAPGDHQVRVNIELTRTDIRLSNFSLIESDPEFIPVRLEQSIVRTVPLTIEVQGNLPASFERGDPETSINGEPLSDVQVEGPQSRVERVSFVQAVANVEQLSASYNSLRDLTPLDSNRMPVEGVSLKPSRVNVRVPIRSVVGLKLVPVLGSIIGSPAPGYVVTDIQSDPLLINIAGSSRTLDKISQIQTMPVDITGATGIVTGYVGMLFPPGVSRQQNEDATVLVTVQIIPLLRPFQVQLPFSVEITGNTSQFIATYEPRVLQLTLAGYASALSTLEQADLVATVNVQGLTPGTYTMKPYISLPDAVRIVEEIPQIHITLNAQPAPPATPTATTVISPPVLLLPTSSVTQSRTQQPSEPLLDDSVEESAPAFLSPVPFDTSFVEPADNAWQTPSAYPDEQPFQMTTTPVDIPSEDVTVLPDEERTQEPESSPVEEGERDTVFITPFVEPMENLLSEETAEATETIPAVETAETAVLDAETAETAVLDAETAETAVLDTETAETAEVTPFATTVLTLTLSPLP